MALTKLTCGPFQVENRTDTVRFICIYIIWNGSLHVFLQMYLFTGRVEPWLEISVDPLPLWLSFSSTLIFNRGRLFLSSISDINFLRSTFSLFSLSFSRNSSDTTLFSFKCLFVPPILCCRTHLKSVELNCHHVHHRCPSHPVCTT